MTKLESLVEVLAKERVDNEIIRDVIVTNYTSPNKKEYDVDGQIYVVLTENETISMLEDRSYELAEDKLYELQESYDTKRLMPGIELDTLINMEKLSEQLSSHMEFTEVFKDHEYFGETYDHLVYEVIE